MENKQTNENKKVADKQTEMIAENHQMSSEIARLKAMVDDDCRVLQVQRENEIDKYKTLLNEKLGSFMNQINNRFTRLFKKSVCYLVGPSTMSIQMLF